jgi:phosphoribosylformimino-5-aminoimidazole carboxamide ribotide isomerase
MQLYPAIDMKDGHCVRLKQGQFDQVKTYWDSPADMAQLWEKKGASYLHLVDLDGALKGRSVNASCIEEIVKTIHIPVELGGGIRSLWDIEEVLRLGVHRAIIGTQAVEHPEMLKEAVRQFGARHIAAGIDAKDGLVAIRGWEQISERSAMDLALEMKEMGVETIIYTDISRDGMLNGPNVEATKALSHATGMNIIASGGVSSMEDLQQIYEAGIQGAIIGKALYEGRIDLAEAVSRFE